MPKSLCVCTPTSTGPRLLMFFTKSANSIGLAMPTVSARRTRSTPAAIAFLTILSKKSWSARVASSSPRETNLNPSCRALRMEALAASSTHFLSRPSFFSIWMSDTGIDRDSTSGLSERAKSISSRRHRHHRANLLPASWALQYSINGGRSSSNGVAKPTSISSIPTAQSPEKISFFWVRLNARPNVWLPSRNVLSINPFIMIDATYYRSLKTRTGR